MRHLKKDLPCVIPTKFGSNLTCGYGGDYEHVNCLRSTSSQMDTGRKVITITHMDL